MAAAYSHLSNETSSPTLSDNVFNEDAGDHAPPLPPRPVVDLGDSAPTLPPRVVSAPHNFDSNKLFVPIKSKRRAPSPPGLDRQRGLLSNRLTQLANTQQHRMVDNYVMDQRPLSAPEPLRFMNHVSQSVNIDTNILITPDSGARPKVSESSTMVFLDKSLNEKNSNESSDFNISLAQNQGAAGMEDIYREEGMRSRVSADSGVDSAQFLEPIASEDLKLSEQQNTNLDGTRFSAELSLFDPLTPSTDTTVDLLEGAGSPPPPALLQTYPSQTSDSGVMEPLISVTNSGEPATQFKPIVNGETSTNFEFGLPTTVKPEQIGVMEDGSAVYLDTSVATNKRRGSSDSSHSSSSNLSKDGIGTNKSDALDNSSQNGDKVRLVQLELDLNLKKE